MAYPMMKVFVAFLAAILLTSCSSSATPTLSPPTPPPPLRSTEPLPTSPPSLSPSSQGEPKLVGFDYRVNDAGEGWNLGSVDIGFKNDSDMPKPAGLPPRDCCVYNVIDAFVETQEGKTYPVKINMRDNQQSVIDLRQMPQLPPGFALVTSGPSLAYGRVSWGSYSAEFKFAKVAHPTFVKFPARPDWTINLATVLAYPQKATDLEDSKFKPIDQLRNRVLFDQPGGARVIFGKVESFVQRAGVCDKVLVHFEIMNRDQLDSAKVKFQYPILAMVEGLGMDYQDAGTIEEEVGPGQTKEGQFPFQMCGGQSHLIIYEGDGKYEIYSLDSTRPRQ